LAPGEPFYCCNEKGDRLGVALWHLSEYALFGRPPRLYLTLTVR